MAIWWRLITARFGHTLRPRIARVYQKGDLVRRGQKLAEVGSRTFNGTKLAL